MFMNKLLILLMVFLASLVLALPEDTKQPIEIEAQSVVVDETTGFNEFSGDAEVRQGSLLLFAELIQVQTDNEEVVSMIAQGSLENLLNTFKAKKIKHVLLKLLQLSLLMM